MIEEKYLKTVSAKLSRDSFAKFRDYCGRKGTTISNQLNQMVRQELENPISGNVAGKMVFEYLPASDKFRWKAELDKGNAAYIEESLNPEFLIHLKESIERAIEERDVFIQKSKNGSVAMPSRIIKEGL